MSVARKIQRNNNVISGQKIKNRYRKRKQIDIKGIKNIFAPFCRIGIGEYVLDTETNELKNLKMQLKS